jgi:hypothetical protein
VWAALFAASIGRSFNVCACSRKDFRAVFFLRKFFRNSVSFNVSDAGRCSGDRRRGNKRGGFRRRNCAAGKTTSCRKENRAARVAFSLPQDLSAELMFETCVNRRSELSAFRSAGFHVE